MSVTSSSSGPNPSLNECTFWPREEVVLSGVIYRMMTVGMILIRSSIRFLTFTSTSSIQNLIFWALVPSSSGRMSRAIWFMFTAFINEFFLILCTEVTTLTSCWTSVSLGNKIYAMTSILSTSRFVSTTHRDSNRKNTVRKAKGYEKARLASLSQFWKVIGEATYA